MQNILMNKFVWLNSIEIQPSSLTLLLFVGACKLKPGLLVLPV